MTLISHDRSMKKEGRGSDVQTLKTLVFEFIFTMALNTLH